MQQCRSAFIRLLELHIHVETQLAHTPGAGLMMKRRRRHTPLAASVHADRNSGKVRV